jgi:ssDNA-binding Zn-finger/Zn-ribbon topoisomerase 1
MSLPITACMFLRAARNEPGARDRLLQTMEFNRGKGGFSFYGCKHAPKCTATEDQLMDLFRAHPETYRLLEGIAEAKPEPPKAKPKRKQRS